MNHVSMRPALARADRQLLLDVIDTANMSDAQLAELIEAKRRAGSAK